MPENKQHKKPPAMSPARAGAGETKAVGDTEGKGELKADNREGNPVAEWQDERDRALSEAAVGPMAPANIGARDPEATKEAAEEEALGRKLDDERKGRLDLPNRPQLDKGDLTRVSRQVGPVGHVAGAQPPMSNTISTDPQGFPDRPKMLDDVGEIRDSAPAPRAAREKK